MSTRATRKKPVPQEQAFVSIVRVHERISYRAKALLKTRGLSQPQYNVLRILRGAGPEGLPCQRIGERLLTHVPDITRLLDRLENGGYVTRARGEGNDRRVVVTRITALGLERLSEIDEPITNLHKEQFSNLSAAEVRQLNDLLSKVMRTGRDKP